MAGALPGPRSGLPGAAVWNLVDIVGRQALQLAFVVILARVLTPSDFGVVAIAMILVVVGSAISEGGVSLAIIQRAEVTDEARTASQITNLVLGLLLTGAAIAVSGLIADFYNQPQLQGLTIVMAPTILFSALAATPLALLIRELDFRSVALAGLCGTIASGVVATVLAVSGGGVFALGLQPLVASLVNATLLHVRVGFRIGRLPSWAAFRSLWSFGGYILVSTLLEVVFARLYAALIGRTDGVRAVGLYARADQSQQMVSAVIGSLISRVSLPVLSRYEARSDEMISRLRKGCIVLMGLNAPIVGLLGALATPAVTIAFGGQWAGAGPILTILCLAAFYFPLQVINVNYVIAAGRPRLYLGLEVAKKVIGLPLIVFGSTHGATGVAWAYVCYSAASLVLNSLPARRMTGYGLFAQLRDTAGGTFVVVPVATTLYVASLLWTAPALLETAALGSLGVVAILLGYLIFRPACIEPLLEAWLTLRRRAPSP